MTARCSSRAGTFATTWWLSGVLGYVPEEAHLYTYLSGLEYLQLVGRLRA